MSEFLCISRKKEKGKIPGRKASLAKKQNNTLPGAAILTRMVSNGHHFLPTGVRGNIKSRAIAVLRERRKTVHCDYGGGDRSLWDPKRKNEINLERLKSNQAHPALAET